MDKTCAVDKTNFDPYILWGTYLLITFTRGIFVLRWVINNVVACQVVVGDSCRNKLNHSGPRARTRQNV